MEKYFVYDANGFLIGVYDTIDEANAAMMANA